ncbi:MAG: hypothetical protein H6Q48_5130, partial [Deltaproteobacteria bacterium]|nr:hypothetical protein [Deltaproteobacteria bacterium]
MRYALCRLIQVLFLGIPAAL